MHASRTTATQRKRPSALLRAIIAASCLAAAGTACAEFDSSVGFGTQHGGIAGAQLSYHVYDVKLNVALGLYGASAGADYFFAPKQSIGVNAFAVLVVAGYGLSWNYYANGRLSSGWRAGIDIGRSWALGEGENYILPSVVGYTFQF